MVPLAPLIHSSAWKANSRKDVSGILYNPVEVEVKRTYKIPSVPKPCHNMWEACIKIRRAGWRTSEVNWTRPSPRRSNLVCASRA